MVYKKIPLYFLIILTFSHIVSPCLFLECICMSNFQYNDIVCTDNQAITLSKRTTSSLNVRLKLQGTHNLDLMIKNILDEFFGLLFAFSDPFRIESF